MARQRFSIATVVAVALLAATTLILGTFAYISYSTERHRRTFELHNDQDTLTDQLAVSLALPVWNLDHAQINRILEGAMRDDNVFAVVLRLSDVNSTVQTVARDNDWRIKPLDHEPSDGEFHKKTRSIILNGKVLGSVQVLVTQRFLDASLRNTRNSMILSILTFDVLLVAFLYLIFWWLVLKPVQVLEQHAAVVSDGKDSVGLPRHAFSGELDSLRQSLNKMIHLLQARYEAMRSSENRFRTLIEMAPAAVSISRLGKTIYVNRKFLDLYGYDGVDELAGKNISEQWAPEFRELIEERARQRAQGLPVPDQYEGVGQRKDGSQFPVHIAVASVELPDGPANVGFLTDITERKRAEERVRISEERFQLAVSGSTDGLWDWNIQTGEVYYAPRFRQLLGYTSPAEFPSNLQTFYSHLYAEDHELVRTALDGHLTRREPYDITFRLCTRGGEYRWFRSRGQALWNTDGQPVRMAGSITDITQQKLAEQSLRDSEERLRELFDHTTDAAFLIHVTREQQFVFEAINPAAERVSGYTNEQTRGRRPEEFMRPEMAAKFLDNFRRCLAASAPIHFRDKVDFRPGTRSFETVLVPIRNEKGRTYRIAGIARDVTESERAEEALRKSEEKFAKAFQASPDGIAITELDTGLFIEVNDGYCNLYGHTREEMIGHTSLELELWENPKVREELVAGLKASGQLCNVETRMRTRTGEIRIVLVSAETIELGDKWCIVSVLHDISGRVQAEHALRESEERYRAVVEFSPISIVIAVNHIIAYINPAGARLLGAERPDQIVGRSIYDFTAPQYHEIMIIRRKAVLEEGTNAPPIESSIIRLDGSSVAVESIAVPFRYAGQPAILNLVHDLTARKKAEDERAEAMWRAQQLHLLYTRQLIESQEAERRRIAGELHDSLGQNVLLIKNRIQLAISAADVHAWKEQLEAASQAASEAVSEVSRISRDLRPYQLDQLGFTRAIEVMLDNAALSTGLRFDRKLDLVDDVITGESATNLYRIAQEVLNNILKHARAGRVKVELERDIRHVRLWIEDDGCGFSPQNPSASGGGLGLRNIVERARILGGTARVDSHPGNGTRVEVTVPISDAGHPPAD